MLILKCLSINWIVRKVLQPLFSFTLNVWCAILHGVVKSIRRVQMLNNTSTDWTKWEHHCWQVFLLNFCSDFSANCATISIAQPIESKTHPSKFTFFVTRLNYWRFQWKLKPISGYEIMQMIQLLIWRSFDAFCVMWKEKIWPNGGFGLYIYLFIAMRAH